MTMPAPPSDRTRQWTADDLLALPDDNMRHELVRGELRIMTPAGGPHGLVNTWLTTLLGRHVQEHNLGVLFSADTGFLLARNPDTVRCPDLAFLSEARIPPGGIGPGFVRGAPDLAVEVLSPDDTVFEIEEKVGEYLAAGSRLVWVISPKARTVTVYRPHAPARVLTADEMLEGGDVIPGFACRVAEIFTWVDKSGTRNCSAR